MLRHGRAYLMSPLYDGLYHWVDPKLVGTVSIFNHVAKAKESEIEMGPYSNWYVSHIDGGNRIYNPYDICYVPFCECLIPWICDSGYPSMDLKSGC